MLHSQTAKHLLLSVLMSVYNGARFLDQAIDSIRCQSFRDFEFLIIDDGSTDASSEILAKHAAADNRIRVISQQNQGLINSLNRGFAGASGAYIARMDADDISKPYRLEMQMDFMSSHPAITLVGGAIELVDAQCKPLDVILLPAEPEAIRKHMRELGCAIAHPTVLFRRDVLQKVGGFRKAYKHAEDYDLWLRMIEGFDFANLQEVLLSYRRHEESVSYKNAVQQTLSAFCARVAAQRRLEGLDDPTSNVDIISFEVLREFGVPTETINEVVFKGLVEVTEDSIRHGLCSAAAEFPQAARSYAGPERWEQVAIELNRNAAKAQTRPEEKAKHRRMLLENAPGIYRRVFNLTSSPGSAGSLATSHTISRTAATGLGDLQKRNRYATDKGEQYLSIYEQTFSHLRTDRIALMEVGVGEGGSLLLWRDYFIRGKIYGVDIAPPLRNFEDSTGRIRILQADQGDFGCLSALASEASPGGFHIIIDDASHVGALTAATFLTLFYKHLRPGGFYAIENWGTGYWESWPDGSKPEIPEHPCFPCRSREFPSHQSGTVGFLKQLVDECALPDIQHPRFGVPGHRKSGIRKIHISPGLVIIEKSVD